MERSLRFGCTGQEAGAQLRQRLRLRAAVGDEAGLRAEAKMRRLERREAPGLQTRGARETTPSPGSGKGGQRGK